MASPWLGRRPEIQRTKTAQASTAAVDLSAANASPASQPADQASMPKPVARRPAMGVGPPETTPSGPPNP